MYDTKIDDRAVASDVRPAMKPRAVADTRARAGRDLVDVMVILAGLIVVARPSIDTLKGVGGVGGLTLLDVVGSLLVALVLPGAIMGLVQVPRMKFLLIPLAFASIGIAFGLIITWWVPARDLVPMCFRVLGMAASFLGFAHLSARRPRIVLPMLVASSAYPLLSGVTQIFTGVPIVGQVNEYVDESVPRLVGSFVHPSELGKFTALVFVFAFCCFLIGPRGRAKAGWGAYAALTGLIMLLTYTRVVWVAAPFAILIVAVICKRPAIPIILFGGAAAVAARVGDVQKRLSGFSSLDVRQRLWSELVPRVNLGDVPFGFGFGRVQAMVQLATVQAGIPFLNQVHNDYLRVFLETGVVGLVLYVATLLGILAISAHALWWLDMTVLGRRLAASLFGCTIVVLITSVTDNLFQRPAIIWTYWALAGAAMQQIYLARKAKAKAKAPASAPVSPVSA